jgi:hypothetical protein
VESGEIGAGRRAPGAVVVAVRSAAELAGNPAIQAA